MINVSIVIPCYNEEAALHDLFDKLFVLPSMCWSKYALDFIFVNDGSKDQTLGLLNKYCLKLPNSRVISHTKNGGFGRALRTGLNAASGDLVVTIDADTNYNHAEIPIILSCMEDGIDIVTASPWCAMDSKQNFPLHRYVFSRALSCIYGWILRNDAPHIRTFTSGFRVYRKHVIKNIKFEADDFIATAEILIRSILRGFKVKEYPTVVHDRKFGRSKLNTVKTIYGHLCMIKKLSKRSDLAK